MKVYKLDEKFIPQIPDRFKNIVCEGCGKPAEVYAVEHDFYYCVPCADVGNLLDAGWELEISSAVYERWGFTVYESGVVTTPT